MFKQRQKKARLSLSVLSCMVGFSLCQGLFFAPGYARYDTFLFGPAPDIKRWYGGEPEIDKARSQLLYNEQDAIFALYLGPLFLKSADCSAKEQAVAARKALKLLPQIQPVVMPPVEGAKKAPVQIKKARQKRAHYLSEELSDSLRYLSWRLRYIAGDTGSVKKEVKDYLNVRNARATREGALLCGDLMALSLEMGRQQKFFDQENLGALAHFLIGVQAVKQASEADLIAVKEYEKNLALAYSDAQLDRPDETKEHYGQALNYLRMHPQNYRPQTDQLRKKLLRLVDVDLFKYENKMHENNDQSKKYEGFAAHMEEEDRQKLKANISRLIDVAYLAKVDGRRTEAAFLFRRAHMLVKYYLPDEEKDYSALYYDLGETLYWDDKFDDSVFYLSKCVRLRSSANFLAIDAVDTNNLLARVKIVQGRSKDALDIFFDDLSRIAARSKLDFIRPESKAETDSDRQALIDKLIAYFPSAGADEKRQIEDGVQGVIDASLPLKQYDLAIFAGEALLKLRRQAVPANPGGIMGVLWGLAYACDCCARPEQAVDYYNRLIEDFALDAHASLPYWYHGRGLDLEMLGRHEQSVPDVKKAIALYQEKLKSEEDEEARDHLTWTIDDLKSNLQTAKKHSVKNADYADLPDNCRWRNERFPLKLYVGTEKQNGFGGPLRRLVQEAVAIWTDYEDSPIKIQYVDDKEKADIFVERVTVYDDIPYGSAGRTSAIFERKGQVETKILTRTHVRVYCPSYDGNDWENQDVKMSEQARTQLKYLLVHELGHVFGLSHSPAGPDIMYWKSCAQKLSSRDMNTVKKIYEGRKASSDHS